MSKATTTCPHCNGTGMSPSRFTLLCRYCRGLGNHTPAELHDELAAANKIITAARRYCTGSHPYPPPPRLSAALAEYDARHR